MKAVLVPPCTLVRPAALVVAALALVAAAVSPARAATTVDLGTAGAFAVLAGSGITNTGESTIVGDIGTSPLATETGTGPCGTDANCVNLTGANHPSDAVADQAKDDLTTAYNAAVGQPADATVTALGGQTFTAGVYKASSSLGLIGEVTLDGQGVQDSVFIFQIGTSFVTDSASTVTLVNGASACNVFFQVGSAATLGSGSTFRGTLLVHDDISLGDAVTVQGRLLGGEQASGEGAVTLIHDTITAPSCAAAGTTGGSTGGSTAGTSGGTTAGTTGSTGTSGGTTTGTAGGGTGGATTGASTTSGGSTTGDTTGGTTAGPSGTAAQEELPRSGSSTSQLALLGMMALLAGAAALLAARSPRRPGRHAR